MALIPGLPDERFKEFAYEQIAQIGKACSFPGRVVIMNILSNGPHTVEEIAGLAGIPLASTSQHLQVLKAANLVVAHRRRSHVVYSVACDKVRFFVAMLKDLATECSSQLQQALVEISESPTRSDCINAEEFLNKMEEPGVVVIDVRPGSEYEKAHVPGALSFPLESLDSRLRELPPDSEYIALCRGRFCILADKAVTVLRDHGFDAKRLDVDITELELAGVRIERAE